MTGVLLGLLGSLAVLAGAQARQPAGRAARRPGGERPGGLVALARGTGLPEGWKRAVGPSLRRRRLRRRDEQLPAWLERTASGLRAGLSLPEALTSTASTTPPPLRAELVELQRAVGGGAGLGLALSRWARSPDASPAVVLVVAALDLGARSGGEVARAVDRVAATLRDRVEAQAEVRALATQARASAAVLAVAPLGFAVLLATVEPAVPRLLLTTPVGWACLVGGLGLEAAGAAWMARIVGEAR